jgi:hypothetical protein
MDKTIFADLKKCYDLFLWLRKVRKTPYSPENKTSKELDNFLLRFRRQSFRQSFGSPAPYEPIDSLIERLYD